MPKKLVLLLLAVVGTSLLATCGIGDGSPGQMVVQKASRGSAPPLTNQDWERAVSEPNNYVGSKVELKGRIFHVIGVQDEAFHFQMFTDPLTRGGNTHVEWGGNVEGLKDGTDVTVTGTFKEMRVTTSLAGTELRIPYVVADSVELLAPKPQSTARASLSPSPTVSPTVVVSPTARPTVAVTPTTTSTVPALVPSPTMTPTLAPQVLSPTPIVTPTQRPATATPSRVPSPAPPSPTPTAIPAPTSTPTPALSVRPTPELIEGGATNRLGLGEAVIREPMEAGRDANGVFLETSTSDQAWNGVGRPPASTGSATLAVDVQQEGKYAIWARMYYQHIDANSAWLRIDNQQAIKVGNEDGGYEQWKWVGWHDGNTDGRIVVTLSQGSHSIQIIGREAGARIGSLIVTDDLDFVPR